MQATGTALRRRAVVGEEAGARGGRRFEHGRLGHGGGPGGHDHDRDGTAVGNRAGRAEPTAGTSSPRTTMLGAVPRRGGGRC